MSLFTARRHDDPAQRQDGPSAALAVLGPDGAEKASPALCDQPLRARRKFAPGGRAVRRYYMCIYVYMRVTLHIYIYI